MVARPRFRFRLQQVRDVLFLAVGLGGIINEARFHEGEPRLTLLVVYLTLLGLPGALGLDVLRDRLRDSDKDPP